MCAICAICPFHRPVALQALRSINLLGFGKERRCFHGIWKEHVANYGYYDGKNAFQYENPASKEKKSYQFRNRIDGAGKTLPPACIDYGALGTNCIESEGQKSAKSPA